MGVIIEAAEQLLAQAPYTEFNTNRVAERAGVSVGSVYQYFGSKEAIVAELRLRAGARMRRDLLDALTRTRGASLEIIIRSLVRAHIATIAQDARLHRVLSTELCDVGVSPDFEIRAVLTGDLDGPTPLRVHLQALAEDAYGAREGWPVLAGAWALIRVMTSLALAEERFDLSTDRLSDEICTAVLLFIERRAADMAGKAEL
ncbi:MAG: helix-turn-helix domain-containing protein [Pseudomonadota bacterium]